MSTMKNDTGHNPVHRHNLVGPHGSEEARFGLRMRLPADDTFASILGDKWEKVCWYLSESDRESALQELRKQHPYYRLGDRPTLVLEKVNRPAASAADNG